MACLGVLSKCKATLSNTGAETVVREGGCYDVEGDLVRRRRVLCEKRQEFEDFDERARPYDSGTIISTQYP